MGAPSSGSLPRIGELDEAFDLRAVGDSPQLQALQLEIEELRVRRIEAERTRSTCVRRFKGLKKLIQEIVDRGENVAEMDHYRELEEVEATTMLTAQRACTALDEQRMALLDRYNELIDEASELGEALVAEDDPASATSVIF